MSDKPDRACSDCGHPIDEQEGANHHETSHPGLCCSCYEEKWWGERGRRRARDGGPGPRGRTTGEESPR